MGDTACDLIFGKFIYPKTCGGHCVRFVIWGAYLSKDLRGTLLAIIIFLKYLNTSNNLNTFNPAPDLNYLNNLNPPK